MLSFTPSYLESHQSGKLQQAIEKARRMLLACEVCPRKCGVDRTAGEVGFCRTGRNAVVCSYHAHFGEEAPLSGSRGSGTIFFSYCNLLCCFCQNFEISHGGEGTPVSPDQLAQMMIRLQKEGCHNINFVTPSHVVPQILEALPVAIEKGLTVPLVYNTGAYDRVAVLELLDGVFDIYMPDFKFVDKSLARAACQAEDYASVAKRAVREMHRQVGDLVLDKSGLAVKGLLVRHLVLPENLADTRAVMDFIATGISPDTYVNIMPQYYPCGQADRIPGLERRITEQEFQAALDAAQKSGIQRLDQRRRVFMLW